MNIWITLSDWMILDESVFEQGAGGGWDSDDEAIAPSESKCRHAKHLSPHIKVTKQRKELERKSRLSADQVVQLAKVTAPSSVMDLLFSISMPPSSVRLRLAPKY